MKTRFRPKNGEKQDPREILKRRDIRQVHNNRRVEVDCQNRDSLKEDMCSRLATRAARSIQRLVLQALRTPRPIVETPLDPRFAGREDGQVVARPRRIGIRRCQDRTQERHPRFARAVDESVCTSGRA